MRHILTPRVKQAIRTLNPNNTLAIIIEFYHTPTSSQLKKIENIGFTIANVSQHIPMVSGNIKIKNIKKFTNFNFIKRIHYDEPITLHNNVFETTTHTEIISLQSVINNTNVDKLHDRGITGKNIKIAVLDTGGVHSFFKKQIIDKFSVIKNESVSSTNHPHGSWCAGSIAGQKTTAEYNNNRFEVKGIAPDAKLIIGKCLSDSGRGNLTNILNGIETAVNKDADIISMSLGSPFSFMGLTPDSQEVDEESKKGVLFSIAAGNSGPNFMTIGSPADARQAITIGSIANDNNISRFSSRGIINDGRIKPDFVTYGGNTTRVIHERIISSGKDNNWSIMAGTSMASAMTAGILALLLEAGMPQNTDIAKSVLAAGRQSKSAISGFGEIDAYNSLKKMENSIKSAMSFNRRRQVSERILSPLSIPLFNLRRVF